MTYSSLRYTCPQKQTPSPFGSPLSSPVSYRAAGRSEEASVTPAVSSSAGLSAACAPVQQAGVHDPEEDHQKQIRHKKLHIIYSPWTIKHV